MAVDSRLAGLESAGPPSSGNPLTATITEQSLAESPIKKRWTTFTPAAKSDAGSGKIVTQCARV